METSHVILWYPYVLCMICAPTSRSQLLIFPFLPFMVHDFFPHLDKHELGYYAGIQECIIDQTSSPKAHINVLARCGRSARCICSQTQHELGCDSLLLH